ncbi:FAD-dependent 5-carboxymethylaminomethyl-2-thiouridine(34) oxidoreductase MnmC [Ideonella sp.]|uniref:FAD-dependent 5-carboxymethylaminomethyl-2-thiouridine(34) oxidoreductase MnmC n=1 Tax=Ideonella sp. TaxID=1929293 RepID=UPI0035AF1DBE
MKTQPIVPARIEWRDGVPFAPDFGDVYHARAGAFAQAQQVFLAGNGLPGRWRGRERFVVLETGFGLGNNFLATWSAWRDDPARSGQLVFVSIEKHPATADDLSRAHAQSPAPALAASLVSAWPPATPGLHVLEFDGGRVRLLLALGDVAAWLPELQLQADAAYLDGFAPARNAPMWDTHLLRGLARLAAPGCTAATWSAARSVRDGLSAAGFRVQRVPGFAGKRDMTVAEVDGQAVARRHGAPAGRRPHPAARRALVVGAGLAGAAAAQALAREGLEVTVLEAGTRPADAGSGNLAGLFHGVVHADDGAHAQWLRAAALRATQVYGPLLAGGTVPGQATGLLRGAADTPWDTLSRLGSQVPAGYARPLSRDEAAAMAGCPVAGAAWCFTGGGWLQPGALARHWLATPGVRCLTDTPVAALRRSEAGWRAVDADGSPLGGAAPWDVVVVCAAAGAVDLLAPHSDAAQWPWRRTRGQVTLLPPAAAAGLPRPRLPLASGGYLIALPEALHPRLGGGLLCGATSQAGDDGAALRPADHLANLAQIARLTSAEGVSPDRLAALAAQAEGRVGWRLGTDDRLPVVGPVPQPLAGLAGQPRLDHPRHVPRVPGLYVMTGLGSRGITWAALAGDVLAACVQGSPLPVAGSLLDAVDPARFVSRAMRQGRP